VGGRINWLQWRLRGAQAGVPLVDHIGGGAPVMQPAQYNSRPAAPESQARVLVARVPVVVCGWPVWAVPAPCHQAAAAGQHVRAQ